MISCNVGRQENQVLKNTRHDIKLQSSPTSMVSKFNALFSLAMNSFVVLPLPLCFNQSWKKNSPNTFNVWITLLNLRRKTMQQ